tara:strand:+ start:683 stop:2038 length:1356 start_codon:yes stop_codon:yes gene_type:complete
MSKVAQQGSHNKYQLADWLRSRFYFIKQQGGQTIYYDAETGVRSLTKMHLVEHLISQGMHSDDPLSTGLEIINNVFFTPIVLQEVYLPRRPKVVNIQGNHHLNSWSEPKIEPDNTINAKPFVEHLERMLGSKAKADYLIDMVAYRYQNPKMLNDQKPHVAFYLYGEKHGYGKGLFAGTLEAVFGESAVTKVIDQSALNSMSAVDVWTRTWVVVEEVDVKKGSTDYNRLKTMIGGGAFSAARKGEHFRKHESPAQLFMLSNHAPTFIEPNDRRFFISEWTTVFESAEEKNNYFSTYAAWLKEEGGYSAIASLLAKRDISQVKIEAPAMMTEEKQAVVSLMTDRAVEEIKLIMEEQPAAICFTADAFKSIWDDHDVPKNQQKYKLSEAGLLATPKKRYSGPTFQFWIRKGWQLQVRNGRKTMLSNKGEQLVKELENDEGYKAAVEAKRADSFL